MFGPHSSCFLVLTDQDTFQVFQLQWSGPITSETKASAGCEASSRQPTGQTGRAAHTEEACQQKMIFKGLLLLRCVCRNISWMVFMSSEKRSENKATQGQMDQPSPESKLDFVRMVWNDVNISMLLHLLFWCWPFLVWECLDLFFQHI